VACPHGSRKNISKWENADQNDPVLGGVSGEAGLNAGEEKVLHTEGGHEWKSERSGSTEGGV